MTINDFITGVTYNISNKITTNSITPAIVGNAFIDLAEIVSGTTSGGTVSVSNGLSITGGTVVLGGPLTGDTSIDTSFLYQLNLGDYNSKTALIQIDPVDFQTTILSIDNVNNFTTFFGVRGNNEGLFGVSFGPSGNTTFGVNHTGFIVECSTHDNTQRKILSIDINNITVTDTASLGIINGGDYEPNFLPRSLATVQYVTGYTNSYLPIFFNDGNETINMNHAILGIGTNSSGLMIDDGNNIVHIGAGGSTYGQLHTDATQTYISYYGNNGSQVITLGSSPIQISDTNNNVGMCYSNDYSSSGSTNPLWIPNIGYVESLLSGGTATLINGTITINNSLIKSTSKIFLTYNNPIGTLGFLQQGIITDSTSFIINSLSNNGTLNTMDNSVVNWFFVN